MIYFILSDMDLWEFISSPDVFYSYLFELPKDSVFYNCDLGCFWYVDNKLVAFSVKWCII